MRNRVNDIDLSTQYEDRSVSSSHHSPTLNGKARKADFNLLLIFSPSGGSPLDMKVWARNGGPPPLSSAHSPLLLHE